MFFILNAAVLIGCCLQLCGGKISEGVFVGVFLSMSSTAVVSKRKPASCLIYTRKDLPPHFQFVFWLHVVSR